MDTVKTICSKYDSISLGSTPAKAWYESRYELPYMRENILQLGLLIDTLETACTYDSISQVYESTIKVLRKYCPIAMAHVSHVYKEGASLYFTFMAKEDFNWENPLITRIRKAVIENFLEKKGTISHHHGVGTALRQFLPIERPEISRTIFMAIKKTLDPNFIMNPSSGLLSKY